MGIADDHPIPLADAGLGNRASLSGAVVHRGHGERAMTAADLLQHVGHQDLAVLQGGPANRAEAAGRALQEGE